MQVVVTGGAGFIGTNLVNHLLQHTSHAVVVFDKLTYAANPHAVEGWRTEPRVTFEQSDIADTAAMERVLAERRPQAIMNLAAETHVDRSIDSPRGFIDTNVTGTFVLLDAARKYSRGLSGQAREGFRFTNAFVVIS